jgi:hypothetical protein
MLFLLESISQNCNNNDSFQIPGFGNVASSTGTIFSVTLPNGNNGKGTGNGNSGTGNPDFVITYNNAIAPDFISIELTLVSNKYS